VDRLNGIDARVVDFLDDVVEALEHMGLRDDTPPP
jgi:hypothetical protein